MSSSHLARAVLHTLRLSVLVCDEEIRLVVQGRAESSAIPVGGNTVGCACFAIKHGRLE